MAASGEAPNIHLLPLLREAVTAGASKGPSTVAPEPVLMHMLEDSSLDQAVRRALVRVVGSYLKDLNASHFEAVSIDDLQLSADRIADWAARNPSELRKVKTPLKAINAVRPLCAARSRPPPQAPHDGSRMALLVVGRLKDF